MHCAWHRGTTRTTLSAEDVAELDSLRGALEDLAVRQVIDRASDEDLASIAKTADMMERAVDAYEMVRCDIAFHDAVFAAAGHQRLADAWDGIRCQVHLFLLTRIGLTTEGYLDCIPREHRELVPRCAPATPRPPSSSSPYTAGTPWTWSPRLPGRTESRTAQGKAVRSCLTATPVRLGRDDRPTAPTRAKKPRLAQDVGDGHPGCAADRRAPPRRPSPRRPRP
ncbi:FCD domain-containing protein [Streptomyces sp. SA15]|uniref:GntR family transcriptional regulator n=1 Tax=Streptomyces sp. SA15 TaxID=934019 RepID=UPI00211BDEDD|nr:FCD domain-containing protein [Streptomyces sp. SA15]